MTTNGCRRQGCIAAQVLVGKVDRPWLAAQVARERGVAGRPPQQADDPLAEAARRPLVDRGPQLGDGQRAREALASLDETDQGHEPDAKATPTPEAGLLMLLQWLVTAELHHLEDMHLRAAAAGLSPATAVRHVNDWGDAQSVTTGLDLPSPLLEVDEPAGIVWVDSTSLSAMLG